MLCRTVPIYWGDPLIGRYFNEDGIIIATNEQAIRDAVMAADSTAYERRRAAVEDNFNRVKALLDPAQVKANFLAALNS